MTRLGWRFVAGALLAVGCDSHPDVDFRDDGIPPSAVPGAPLDAVAVAGTGLISLTWSAPPTGVPATAYRVLVATTSFDLWDANLPGAVATTAACCAFVSTGLADEVTYWLGVTATNAAGEGPISQVVSARPPGWAGYQVLDPAAGGSVALSAVAASASSVFVGGGAIGIFDGVSSEGGYDALVSRLDRTGRRAWTRMHGTGDASDVYLDQMKGVAVDSAGSVVIVGTQDLGLGSTDYLVARYSEDGSLDFNLLLGTASNDEAGGVATDAAWNIYVAGTTQGNLDGQTHLGLGDAFLVKFNSAGVRVSTKLLSTASSELGHGVAAMPDGTAFVVGATAGTLPGVTPAGQGIDGFVAKFNPAGTLQWTKQITSAATDRVRAVAVDAAGNVYVAGETEGTVGDGVLSGVSDAFIGKYNSIGTQLWLHMLGSAGFDRGLGIAVSADTVYVVGDSGTGLGSGYSDGFLAAYSLSGVFSWVRPIGTDQSDTASSVVVGPDGLIYVGGSFNTNRAVDGFVGKFSSAGELQ